MLLSCRSPQPDIHAAARSGHAAIGSSRDRREIVSSSLITSRCALRPVSLPSCPEEDGRAG